MSTRWKGNFINFSIELYFVIYSVMYEGGNPRGRGSGNMMGTRVEMRTTTTKRGLGNASTRPHMKKFRGCEQNKDPWSIGK
jgi:hypothetical protein